MYTSFRVPRTPPRLRTPSPPPAIRSLHSVQTSRSSPPYSPPPPLSPSPYALIYPNLAQIPLFDAEELDFGEILDWTNLTPWAATPYIPESPRSPASLHVASPVRATAADRATRRLSPDAAPCPSPIHSGCTLPAHIVGGAFGGHRSSNHSGDENVARSVTERGAFGRVGAGEAAKGVCRDVRSDVPESDADPAGEFTDPVAQAVGWVAARDQRIIEVVGQVHKLRKWLREQTADTQAARRELAEVAAHEPALLHEEVALLREEIAGLREENAEQKRELARARHEVERLRLQQEEALHLLQQQQQQEGPQQRPASSSPYSPPVSLPAISSPLSSLQSSLFSSRPASRAGSGVLSPPPRSRSRSPPAAAVKKARVAKQKALAPTRRQPGRACKK